MTTEASFRWRLGRLHIEEGVYYPLNFDKSSGTYYKNAYLNSRKKKILWRENNDGGAKNYYSDDSFNIKVSVRFKPLNCSQREGREKAVTLPLHQRLALIRSEHNLTSNSEALDILKKEGAWFKDKWAAMEASKDNEEKKSEDANGIEPKESQESLFCGVNTIDSENNSVVIVDPTKGLRNFIFDEVHSDHSTQESIYLKSACPVICDFINGTNGSIMSYGVTGSGKTHTMFGPDDSFAIERDDYATGSLAGVVPRATKEIFDTLKYRENNLNLKIKANVAVSYVEVYGNQICDLLRLGSLCNPNTAASQRFILSGQHEVAVETVSDVMKILQLGENQKRRAATAMNQRSSRAHSIFIVTLNQVCESTNVSRTSKLFLVDLGGCEQIKKSEIYSGESKHFERMKKEASNFMGDNEKEVAEYNGPGDEENEFSTGFVKSQRMREAVNINLGLMALKACVSSLVSGRKYVPYADSKLTLILCTALGGNSKTSVIVCASQDKDLVPETIATLKFAQSCRQVKNNIFSETDFLKRILDNIDSKIAHCEKDIREKERWEVREEVYEDSLAEEGTLESKGFKGREIHKTTILVGAEEERKRLDELLKQKAAITGTSIRHDFGGQRFGGSVGFGVAYKYGLGEKKSVNDDDVPSYRFGQVEDSNIPETVKKAGGRGWNAYGSKEDDKRVRLQLLKKKKRSTLVYSGISA